MLNFKKINNIELVTSSDNKEIIVSQAKILCDVIFKETAIVTENKEYPIIYKKFIESIDKRYRTLIPDILDVSARLIIHEIYLAIDCPIDININFPDLKKLPIEKQKHFLTAKNIAEKIIKIYYYSKCKEKQIINYIDEFLPESYDEPSDIDYVVWYFLVCISHYNKEVTINV